MERDIATSFIYLFRRFKQQMQIQVKALDLDITFLHFIALKEISLIDQCTPQMLADILCRDKGQITRLLKELINKGIVHKVPNPADKRSQYLSITDKGQEYIQISAVAEQNVFKAMMADIPATDMKVWQQITDLMSHNLSKAES